MDIAQLDDEIAATKDVISELKLSGNPGALALAEEDLKYYQQERNALNC